MSPPRPASPTSVVPRARPGATTMATAGSTSSSRTWARSPASTTTKGTGAAGDGACRRTTLAVARSDHRAGRLERLSRAGPGIPRQGVAAGVCRASHGDIRGAGSSGPGREAGNQAPGFDLDRSISRLIGDGASSELVDLFETAGRALQELGATPPDPSEADRARSAAERFLFERLESLPETTGLFRLNATLGFRFGPSRAVEVDLAALIVESRRRDRRLLPFSGPSLLPPRSSQGRRVAAAWIPGGPRAGRGCRLPAGRGARYHPGGSRILSATGTQMMRTHR